MLGNTMDAGATPAPEPFDQHRAYRLDATLSDPPPTVTAMEKLTDDEQKILDFERHWWKHRGAKEDAILATFDCSATRYYARLNALIDDERALAADPMRRLRRLRTARQRQRSAERLRVDGMRR